MATAAMKAPAAAEEAAAPPRKKGMGKLIIVIAVVVLLAGGAAAGGMWWWSQHNAATAKDAKDGKDAKADTKKEAGEPPQYVNVDPFVVNLAGENSDHYLQTAMVLAVKDEATGDSIKRYMPLIRNRILLLLSSQRAEDLNAPDAKPKLAAEILKQTRDTLPAGKDDKDDKGIQNVLFSSFIIQ